MTITTKRRSLPLGKLGGVTDTVGTLSDSSFDISQIQTTVSEGHPFRSFQRNRSSYKRRNDPSWIPDLGGNFWTEEPFYSNNFPAVVLNSRQQYQGRPFYIYKGVLGTASAPHWSTVRTTLASNVSSNQTLEAWGTSAIAKVIPTKPAADAAVSVAEILREGIPKAVGLTLLKSKFRDPRKLGDEYLNYQFGWVPLVGGIQDIMKSASEAEKILAQLYRDNGRIVRRRLIGSPSKKVVSSVLTGSLYPRSTVAGHFPIGAGPFKEYREITVDQQRWFSGAFTYHIPVDEQRDSLMMRFTEMKKLYGIKFDLDVLYNLTPWSWAADWIVNGGDIAANLSAFSQDGLIMRYGYVMETTTVTVTDTLTGVLANNGFKGDLRQTYGITVKNRRRATPYGFGLKESEFSDYQKAIVAAFGISRMPKLGK